MVLLAAPAEAQLPAEVIHDYAVQIEILDDGDLRITETIDYDFGEQLRHGIFRTIPSRFPYDDVHDRVYPDRGRHGRRATRPMTSTSRKKAPPP